MKDYEQYELPNGIRIVHKQITSTKIAHVGLMLDIGSRDETPEEQGIAHFWEHMAFKGTKKRKAFHIINRLESLGGELNAYTTKEKICFYASILDTHLDKAVDIITDITFQATFPQKQIEKERGVILEEMAMYKDTPEDSLQDDFDEQLFPNHALGFNILGTERTVRAFRQSDFKRFVKNHLNTHKIVLSSVGSYSLKKLVRLAKKYFHDIPEKNGVMPRERFEGYQPSIKEVQKPILQAHCAIGSTAFPIGHPERISFYMLLNILGGPGMNSRLNLSLREKYGYVYGVEANYNAYTDAGTLGVFFATEKSNLKKSINLVWREFDKLKKSSLGKLQLHAAKQQLKGQLAMSEENYSSVMLVMAKNVLDLDRVIGLDEIFVEIEQIDANHLVDLANQTLLQEKMSVLTYMPG